MEKNENVLQLSTTITRKDALSYFLHSTFSHGFGVARILISTGFLVGAILSFGKVDLLATILLCVFGVLNPVITPILLYFKALGIEQKKSSYHFSFNEDGFRVEQDGQDKILPWNNLAGIEILKSLIVLKIDKQTAFIIPRKDLHGEDENTVMQLFQTLKNSSAVRIRTLS